MLGHPGQTYIFTPPRYGSGVLRSVCLSVCISGTAGQIFTKFFVQINCGHGSVLLWQLCDMLCIYGFMDDVTFGHSEPYGDAWKAESLTCYH